MLRVQLVGDLRLELDGRPIHPPRWRRARAVLAWLALHPGMHPRRALAARFWPDVLDESARTSLRTALTELRQALGDAAGQLAATRDSVGLPADERLWVDVREVDRLLAAGRLEDAVAIANGELLPGMDDEWVLEARDALSARLGDALEELARRAEQAGDHAEAVRRTRAALALDPLGEELHRRLIRRLAVGGDRAAALAAYEQLAERLRSELRIAPSAPTRALVEELRRGMAARAGEIRAPAALTRADETPFVGRGAELERLRAAWAGATRHETRRCVLLAGEPGIGKTRLALRFARGPQRDGAVVLVGRCSEEPLGPYEPFAEMLRHCAASLAGDSLTPLVGPDGGEALDRLAGEARGDAQRDPGARHRLFDAVDAALTAFAAGRPLLLLIDDLQWADRPTQLLLGFLLRSPRRSPAMVVATCREAALRAGSSVAATLAELRRDGLLDRIALGGLTRDDVTALVNSWLGGSEEAIAGALHARTGGNAFFVEEVLRGLRDDGTDAVPESVRQAIAARLAGLRADAEAMLAIASILGLDVDVALLQRTAGLGVGAAESALDELLAAHLLRPVAGSPDRVEFPHALVREAVDAGLNPIRRARLHRHAAEALIAISEETHLEQIAHHLFCAVAPDDAARAVDYLERAGRRAATMLAYEEAAGHLARALELLATHAPPADPRAGALTIARGDALLRAGDPAAAGECFAAAAALARRTGDADLLARAALGRAGLGVSIISVDAERVWLLEEALGALGDADPVLSSQVLARLAVELYYAPARDRSEALSAEAVRLARAAGEPLAAASALNARHVALWRPDRLDERLRTADEMLELARAAGERHLELQARNWRVVDLFEAGDLVAWRAEVRRHGALAEELRLPAFAWYAPLWAAVDALHAGRFAEGRALAAEARAAGERAGDPNAELFAVMLRFQDAVLRGDYEHADLDYARDKIAASPAGLSWRCGYAWMLAGLGRLDEAREHFEIVSADDFGRLPFDMNWPSAMCESAETCVILGDRERAAPLYELIRPYAGRPLTAGRAIASYGAADRCLGGLCVVLGRLDDAVGHFTRAIDLDRAAGLRPWALRSRLGLADALERRGETTAAAEHAGRAAAEAAELGLADVSRRASPRRTLAPAAPSRGARR